MISLKSKSWQIDNVETVLFDKDGTFIDLHYFWGKMTELRVQEIIKRFELDVEYRNNLTFINDVKIIVNTVKAVLSHDNIELNALENFDEYRKKQIHNPNIDTVSGTIQK